MLIRFRQKAFPVPSLVTPTPRFSVPSKYLPLLVENRKPNTNNQKPEVSISRYPLAPNRGFAPQEEIPKKITDAFKKITQQWMQENGIQTLGNQSIDDYLNSALKGIVTNGHLIVMKNPEGEIIGFGGLKYQREISELINSTIQEIAKVGLDPNYRGQGLGEKLLKEILKQALRETTQASSVVLETATPLGPACRIYWHLGFKNLMKELKSQLKKINSPEIQKSFEKIQEIFNKEKSLQEKPEKIQSIFQTSPYLTIKEPLKNAQEVLKELSIGAPPLPRSLESYKEQKKLAPIFDKAEFKKQLEELQKAIKNQQGLDESFHEIEKLIELLKTFDHPNTNLFMSILLEVLRKDAAARKILKGLT